MDTNICSNPFSSRTRVFGKCRLHLLLAVRYSDGFSLSFRSNVRRALRALLLLAVVFAETWICCVVIKTLFFIASWCTIICSCLVTQQTSPLDSPVAGILGDGVNKQAWHVWFLLLVKNLRAVILALTYKTQAKKTVPEQSASSPSLLMNSSIFLFLVSPTVALHDSVHNNA